MQHKLHLAYILFFLSMVSQTIAQQDTVHQLKQVEIKTEVRILHHNQGLKTETLDSTLLANSLNLSAAEVLNRMSSVYIKSYGGSGLASSSFRGGSANHTAILWNGFNLQSPVTGMIDLSLLPAGLFNAVTLQYGGKGAAWGSGAIGGAIHLQSKSNFNAGSTVKLYTGAGSFNEKTVLGAATYSTVKFINSTKLYHTASQNNFPYTTVINDSLQTQRLQNAHADQTTLLQENYFRIKDNQVLETHIWLQENKRQIPPTLYQLTSNAFQEDRAMRFTASYHHYYKLWDITLKSAYFNEEIKYKDSEYSKLNENISQTFIQECVANRNFNKNILSFGVNNTYAKSHSIDFSRLNPMQNKIALFSSFQYNNTKGNLMAVASLRQEWVNTTIVPLTWSAGVDYQLVKWLGLKANAARLYRIPTINDLFWKEGGNQELLPENGYAFEAGMKGTIFPNQKKHILTIELTAFSRRIENWIIWLPNGGFWSPQNLLNVWSRGAESTTSYLLNLKRFNLFSNFKTSYILSENTQSQLQGDASTDKQLIYVPLYSGQLNWGINYKNATILFNHTYTGYRYTSSDHSEYLEPYYMNNINLAYKFELKKVSLDLQFQINNVLNENYKVLAARPMPGINYRGGIVINFKSNYGKS